MESAAEAKLAEERLSAAAAAATAAQQIQALKLDAAELSLACNSATVRIREDEKRREEAEQPHAVLQADNLRLRGQLERADERRQYVEVQQTVLLCDMLMLHLLWLGRCGITDVDVAVLT